MLLLELAIFSQIGRNFWTLGNGFEILRLTVELGLLALALTPVIVTGGIDLSVGSVLGLTAILMGMIWKDAGWPLAIAIPIALVASLAAGGINALLITRLRIPPLIVTLGSMSLFRGVAEGITGGARNYTDFPSWFQFLGQGYLGVIPTQAPLFVIAAIGYWLLLHRSVMGRSLQAIGYSADGARYAGIAVERRVGLAYLMCGLLAGVAGVLYAAHWNQAKADAGAGYELEAITAVVLGGTSIFGGRGSIVGTLLGLFAIAVLKNGLHLAQLPPTMVDLLSAGIHHLPLGVGNWILAPGESIGGALPTELANILTGLLLLIAIAADFRPAAGQATAKNNEEFEMKNSQIAVLCFFMLLAAGIIAGGNFYLVQSLRQDAQGHSVGPAVSATLAQTPTPGGKRITVAMMPKSKGNAYFISCKKGADDAAKELGVDLLWDGPTDPDPAKQNEVIEAWITRGVDVIAVACENGQGIASVLSKARDKGIKVVTWDSDTKPDSRDFFVTQALPDAMGQTLMENAAKVMGNKGKFAIITASLTAENMIAWQNAIEKYRAKDHPDMTMATIEPCDDKQQVAFDKANQILGAYPDVKVIMAICSPAAPGAAEAVKQSGRKDVKVVGVSLPNDNKPYVHAGITDDIVLWNTYDLGYLTIQAAVQLQAGKLKAGDTSVSGGKCGTKEINGSVINLGKPFTFTKDNIDQFDF